MANLSKLTLKLKTIKVTKIQCLKLFEVAENHLQNSYPKPNKVSAAVLTKLRNIYPGVSYHTDIMSLTMHAEATALAHAAIHGEKEIIAITGPNCHACKQLIWENALKSGIDIQVVFREKSRFKAIPISKMMLYPWPNSNTT